MNNNAIITEVKVGDEFEIICKIKINEYDASDDAYLVVCSNVVFDWLPKEEIIDMVNSSNPEYKKKKLIDQKEELKAKLAQLQKEIEAI